MKHAYTELDAELIRFEAADVIMSSPTTTEEIEDNGSGQSVNGFGLF